MILYTIIAKVELLLLLLVKFGVQNNLSAVPTVQFI